MPSMKSTARTFAVLLWPALTLGYAWVSLSGTLERSAPASQVAAPLAGPAGRAQDWRSAARLDGEYGLWVGVGDDSLEVRWITREPAAGLLRVFVGTALNREFETLAAFAHSVSFPKPPATQLVLRYGSLDDPEDRHETAIEIHAGRQRELPIFSGVDSIFAVGDVHGEYDRLIGLLANAGLIDQGQRWTGGRSHVVFLGDLFDRGPDVTRVLWFVYRLESEARAQGGRVHVMLGNHEIMVMTKELSYVSRKEFLLADYHGLEYNQMFDPRHSLLGKWLAAKPALLKIDDILFAHAGVSPAFMDYSIESFDDSLAAFISEPLFYYWSDTTVTVTPMDSATLARHIDFFFAENSIFWYRDYVLTDTLQDALAAVLDRFDARLHVVGHTPVPHIQQRYDSVLIAVDLEEAASEMLLLARTGTDYDRYLCRLEGPAEPLTAPEPLTSPPPGQSLRSAATEER
jgi:hypothetical protein